MEKLPILKISDFKEPVQDFRELRALGRVFGYPIKSQGAEGRFS